MKNLFVIVFIACSIMNAYAQDDFRYIHINTELMVFDRAEAIDSLTEWAESRKGYFTEKTDKSLRLRIPDNLIPIFRDKLSSVSETIVVFDQNTVDLREEYQRVVSAIEAREEVLERNLQYISTSDVEGTLELEKEIRRLMNGIDMYQGRLRKMNHDRKMALVEIALDFQNRSVPEWRPSNFDWINAVDFFHFVQGIEPSSKRLSAFWQKTSLPGGFAKLSHKPLLQAVSAKGVLLQIRQVDNYPKQSQDFWQTALTESLSVRGYRALEGYRGLDWKDAKDFEYRVWGLPWASKDYIYVTGIRVLDKNIEIIELAGPAELAAAYLKSGY